MTSGTIDIREVLASIDPRDVLAVLSSIAPTQRRGSKKRETIFAQQAGDAFRVTKFPREAPLVEAYSIRARDELRAAVAEYSLPAPPVLVRTYAFACRPLSGHFRIGGKLQVFPGTKPQLPPPYNMRGRADGAASPLVIELMVDQCQNQFVSSRWIVRKLRETVRLLTAFLEVPIYQRWGPSFVWIVRPDFTYEVAMSGFGMELEPDEFTDCSSLPAATRFASAQYFRALGIGTPSIRVPDDVEKLFSLVELLSAQERVQFERACASLSDAASPLLPSGLHTQALVSALESLLPRTKGPSCPTCRQKRFGVTARFNEFIRAYVPPGQIGALLAQLYSTRSQLTHGLSHFDIDEDFDTVSPQSSIAPELAFYAAKNGMVNWLRSRVHQCRHRARLCSVVKRSMLTFQASSRVNWRTALVRGNHEI